MNQLGHQPGGISWGASARGHQLGSISRVITWDISWRISWGISLSISWGISLGIRWGASAGRHQLGGISWSVPLHVDARVSLQAPYRSADLNRAMVPCRGP